MPSRPYGSLPCKSGSTPGAVCGNGVCETGDGEDCQSWGAATIADGKYAAIGWAAVTSQDAFNAAMGTHGAAIMGDVPNYTNVAPEMLIGEIAGREQIALRLRGG